MKANYVSCVTSTKLQLFNFLQKSGTFSNLYWGFSTWSHKLAHTFKIMFLSTTTGDKNMRNHYENLVRPKHTKTHFAPSPIHVLINPRVRKGLC